MSCVEISTEQKKGNKREEKRREEERREEKRKKKSSEPLVFFSCLLHLDSWFMAWLAQEFFSLFSSRSFCLFFPSGVFVYFFPQEFFCILIWKTLALKRGVVAELWVLGEQWNSSLEDGAWRFWFKVWFKDWFKDWLLTVVLIGSILPLGWRLGNTTIWARWDRRLTLASEQAG